MSGIGRNRIHGCFNSDCYEALVIAIYDSGVGGITLARKILFAHPSANLVYFMDNAWFPYGEKSPDQLTARVSSVLTYLESGTVPDLTVIACNTATTSLPKCIEPMLGRRLFGVSPLCAPPDDNAIVLCTPATKRNLTQASGFSSPRIIGVPELADVAERKFAEPGDRTTDVARVLMRQFDSRCIEHAETVILGCTHYALLLDELKDLFPHVANWIDPVDQLAELVLKQAAKYGADTLSNGYRTIRYTGSITKSLSQALTRSGFGEFGHLPI